MKRIIFLAGFVSIFCLGPAFAGQVGDINIRGFISQGYLQTEDNNYIQNSKDGTFEFNEVGINFSTQMDELRLGMQLFSRDYGNIGNNELVIDWAFADYAFATQLGLRVGIVKIPYGFYNETRYMDPLRTSILLPSSVYNEVYRDAFSSMKCAGIYGSFLSQKIGSLEYQAQVGVTPMEIDGGFAKLMSFFLDVEEANADSSIAGALTYNAPIENLRFRVSHYNTQFSLSGPATPLQSIMRGIPAGTPIQYDLDTTFDAFSAEFIRNRFRLTGEYQLTNVAFALAGITGETDFDQEGWYVEGAYRFCDYFELGLYYSEFYYYKDDKDGKEHVARGTIAYDHNAWQKDICLTGRFDITDNWIFKLEGHKVNGTAQIEPGVVNENLEEDWYMYIAKVSYNFW